jgi:hypothetical protein
MKITTTSAVCSSKNITFLFDEFMPPTGRSGDTRHQFDPDDATAVAEAERRFVKLTSAGFIAAERAGNGTTELIRQFDPAAQETVFIPRLVGG